jgi:hypothetical protein
MTTLYAVPSPDSLPSYDDFGFLPSAGTLFTLGNRTYLVKAIQNPDDATVTVNIPVLVRIKVRYPSEFNQDRWLTFDPFDADDPRVTHVTTVYNTGDLDIGGSDANADPTQSVDVQRIDQITDLDPTEAAQKRRPWFDNVTGEGDQNRPAHFSHLATHIARWYQSDGAGNIVNSSVFLDIEYVDKVRISQNDVGANDVSSVGLQHGTGILGQIYNFSFVPHWVNQMNDDGTFSTDSNPRPFALAA